MFRSHILPIDIQYLSLDFVTVNKKRIYGRVRVITIVYIITECVVSIKVMLMMDYISISLAVIVSLVMWWSFLAISGLKGSCPNRLTADSSSQKNEVLACYWIEVEIYIEYYYILKSAS